MSSSKVAPAAEENNSGGSSSSRGPVSETLRLSQLRASEYHLDVGDVYPSHEAFEELAKQP